MSILSTVLRDKKSAWQLGGFIAGISIAANLLVAFGGSVFLPKDHFERIELGMLGMKRHFDTVTAQTNVDLSNVKAEIKLRFDTIATRRADNELKDRAIFAFICDNMADMRKRDLGIQRKCFDLRGGR